MKQIVWWSGLCTVAFAVAFAGAKAQPVRTTDPLNLPPTNGAGWYSASGDSVCFHVEYGTNQGLPPENTFTGVLVRAHSIIVDNFRNITNWFDGNDQVIRFDANLTANLAELSGIEPVPEWVVTLGGNMQVRLAGRRGYATGTFPLLVESLSFTLNWADLGMGLSGPFLNSRTMPSPVSGGELSVTALSVSEYEVTGRLTVHSEAAMYRTDHWLPYWPDTNRPTHYALLPLQPPPAAISILTNGSAPAASGQFQMRRNIRYIFERSSDLRNWTTLETNYSGGFGLGELFKFVEPLTNSTGFYRSQSMLVTYAPAAVQVKPVNAPSLSDPPARQEPP